MFSTIKWVLVIAVGSFMPAQDAGLRETVQLGAILDQAMGAEHVEPMDSQTYEVVRNLFTRMHRGSHDHEALSAEWHALGYDLIEATSAGTPVLVVRDRHRRGRGVFTFRRGATTPLLIEAPHAVGSDDQHTRRIGLHVFQTSRAVAAGWSTVPRRIHDTAHETGTLFQAFTESFATTYPRGRVIQIHGYRRSNRTTTAGREAEAILSNGTATASPGLYEVVSCLDREVRINALAYPRDVTELGATTNAQGRLLGAIGHAGFMHVELSRSLRRLMVRNARLSGQVSSCLGRGLS